jgi:hypothetical protein
LTVRNNDTLPINGGLLEIQSSIGTNLFAVNDYNTEYATNGGAETAGGTSTTFPASTWAAATTGGTVTRTVTAGQFATGAAGVSIVTTAATHGAKDTLNATLAGSTMYQVNFTGKAATASFSTLDIYYSVDGTATSSTCATAKTLTNTTWTKVSCTFSTTAGMTSTNAIIIRQSDGTGRTFYIDNLSVTPITTTATPANVQIGGGAFGGQPALLTLDQFSAAPVAAGNTTYYGSMYFDTTLGNIQCYEADGWGACGSAPDNIITLTPEYTGAVMNGTGVGTMTADFCSADLGVGSLCTGHEARNFYKWTSPQPSTQTYSIYVSYKLPSTFKNFVTSTTSLTGYTDDKNNSGISYTIYRKPNDGTAVTTCSAEKTVVGWDYVGLTAIGSNATWTTTTPTTDPATGACGPGGGSALVAGDTVIFKIIVNARSSTNAYVENLTFRYANK